MALQDYLNIASVASAILTFFIVLIVKRVEGQSIHLDDLITRALSASAIPTGLLLIACAFYPSLLARLTGLNIYIAVAGLTLLFVACKRIFSKG